jgi:hypothetical protein
LNRKQPAIAGDMLYSLRTDYRVAKATFFDEGLKLALAVLSTQQHDNKPFGRYLLFEVGLKQATNDG